MKCCWIGCKKQANPGTNLVVEKDGKDVIKVPMCSWHWEVWGKLEENEELEASNV